MKVSKRKGTFSNPIWVTSILYFSLLLFLLCYLLKYLLMFNETGTKKISKVQRPPIFRARATLFYKLGSIF